MTKRVHKKPRLPTFLNSYNQINRVEFRDLDTVRKHLLSLLAYIDKGSFESSEDIEDALEYFGFEVEVSHDQDAYAGYSDFTIGSPLRTVPNPVKVIPNPVKDPNFFELLRALDHTMKLLSQSIRSINDPDRLTSDIKAVRAYLDAFSDFLSVQHINLAPEELPGALPAGLLAKLKKVDWLRFSENIQKWVDVIVKTCDLILKR